MSQPALSDGRFSYRSPAITVGTIVSTVGQPPPNRVSLRNDCEADFPGEIEAGLDASREQVRHTDARRGHTVAIVAGQTVYNGISGHFVSTTGHFVSTV